MINSLASAKITTKIIK